MDFIGLASMMGMPPPPSFQHLQNSGNRWNGIHHPQLPQYTNVPNLRVEGDDSDSDVDYSSESDDDEYSDYFYSDDDNDDDDDDDEEEEISDDEDEDDDDSQSIIEKIDKKDSKKSLLSPDKSWKELENEGKQEMTIETPDKFLTPTRKTKGDSAEKTGVKGLMDEERKREKARALWKGLAGGYLAKIRTDPTMEMSNTLAKVPIEKRIKTHEEELDEIKGSHLFDHYSLEENYEMAMDENLEKQERKIIKQIGSPNRKGRRKISNAAKEIITKRHEKEKEKFQPIIKDLEGKLEEAKEKIDDYFDEIEDKTGEDVEIQNIKNVPAEIKAVNGALIYDWNKIVKQNNIDVDRISYSRSGGKPYMLSFKDDNNKIQKIYFPSLSSIQKWATQNGYQINNVGGPTEISKKLNKPFAFEKVVFVKKDTNKRGVKINVMNGTMSLLPPHNLISQMPEFKKLFQSQNVKGVVLKLNDEGAEKILEKGKKKK